MAEWLSSRTRFASPGFCWFGSWARTGHHSSSHAEAASQIAQPEALTTRIYSYVLRGFGEKKKKNKRVATDVSSGANLKKKQKTKKDHVDTN